MKTFESQNKIYRVREYINGYEFDKLTNKLFDISKKAKASNIKLDMDSLETNPEMGMEILPILKEVAQSMIEDPKVTDINSLDQKLIFELQQHVLEIFTSYNSLIQASKPPAEGDKKKALATANLV